MIARDGFRGSRSRSTGGHPNNPAPMAQGMNMVITGSLADAAGIYEASIAVGVVPDHPYPFAWALARVWMVLGVDESGAGEAYSNFEFRAGSSPADYEVLASLDTSGNPPAGTSVTASIKPRIVEAGDVLFVYPTQVGVGSVDFSAERVLVGFEFVTKLLA